ncbi:MAG: hypothetical protein ACREON_08240 [Gemmatimonadaceae bacterium]
MEPRRQITQELDAARLRLTADLALACERLQREPADAVLPLLREPARVFGKSARHHGAPVERMVVVLKECISESHLARLEPDWYRDAREQLMRWALDAFYAVNGTGKSEA